MDITFKFEIVLGEEVIQCNSLNDAEKKLKSLRHSEIDCFLVRKEYEDKKLIGEYYVG
jgi:hypothetical protein